MIKICILAAILSLALALNNDDLNKVGEVEKEDSVLILTDDNFDSEIKKHKIILVAFVAEWCGFCKKLKPEYAAAAEVLSVYNPPIPLAKVDAINQKKLSERYGIKGFPTMLWFRNGKKMDQEYEGGRQTDLIIKWMVNKAKPASTQVTCNILVAAIEGSQQIMAYFGPETDDLYTKTHLPYAEEEEKIAFYHVTEHDEDCAKAFNMTYPGIMFFRKFETYQMLYQGASELEELKSFVKPLMIQTVFEFTYERMDVVFGGVKPALVFFIDMSKHQQANFMKTYKRASHVFQGKIEFIYSDVEEPMQKKLAETMGVTKEDLPTLRAILPASMKKYKSPIENMDDLTVGNIERFIDLVLSEKLKSYWKSDDIPASNDGPVTTIVGKEYDKIVQDTTKDVAVLYTNPKSRENKDLIPVWQALGEHFKDNKNVVIGQMEHGRNEAKGLEVAGYPTIRFFAKGNKEGVQYDSENKDLDSLKAWLEGLLGGQDKQKHDEL